MTTKTTVAPPAERRSSVEAEGFSLLVMSAEAFASLPLPRSGTVIVGRSTKCDVQVDDPLASRQHVRLHIGDKLEIEDLQSANRTHVRDVPILPGVRVPLARGEAIGIGSTVLVVEGAHRAGAPRRIWSHRFFEVRLREECGRAQESGRAFALVRLHLDTPAAWSKVVPLMDRDVPPPHLFAAYGPHDYELLLFDLAEEDAAHATDSLRRSLQGLDVASRAAIAWYPRDGRTADALLARANTLLRPNADGVPPEVLVPGDMSRAMQPVYALASRAAKGTINVLILGETGVGKEVMAQTIHRLSPRAGQPFLPLNCAGLSEGLLESELFGYEKGAFTGAVQSKKGLFEVARGGTLFLDEIGEMPITVQARVLRSVANREILPLGSLKPRPIDVRIVAATNRDLHAEMAKGTFRRDLYYRLNGLTLTVPPLRERRSEMGHLMATFLAHTARETGRPVPEMSLAARQVLEAHDWPGNIRELRNVIERALVLCEGDTIRPEHLSLETGRVPAMSDAAGTEEMRIHARGLSADEEDERRRIVDALRANVWNQSRAARALNMPRRTFVAKLVRFGIPRPQKAATPSPPPDGAEEDPDDLA
jgi:transcriptional regulator with AAA-type ATPase domain